MQVGHCQVSSSRANDLGRRDQCPKFHSHIASQSIFNEIWDNYFNGGTEERSEFCSALDLYPNSQGLHVTYMI